MQYYGALRSPYSWQMFLVLSMTPSQESITDIFHLIIVLTLNFNSTITGHSYFSLSLFLSFDRPIIPITPLNNHGLCSPNFHTSHFAHETLLFVFPSHRWQYLRSIVSAWICFGIRASKVQGWYNSGCWCYRCSWRHRLLPLQ
jgi:hypothetical protein